MTESPAGDLSATELDVPLEKAVHSSMKITCIRTHHLVQIAQPDLAHCGGLSEALRIRTLASSRGINVVPHCWGTMLNVAAATHFLATGYREPGRTEVDPLMLEFDRTPNSLQDGLFDVPVVIEDGVATVPTGPGLGVTLNEEKMRSCIVNQTERKE